MNNIIESFYYSDYKKIYNALQDDESRRIYKKRIMYSFTGDYENVIDTFSDLSFAGMQERVFSKFYNKLNGAFRELEDEFIVELEKIMGTRTIVLCGAKGKNARHIYSRLSNKNVILCDKNDDGHTFFNYWEIARKCNNALWVIPCYQYNEIINELIELGINKQDIVHFDVSHRLEWSRKIMEYIWSEDEIRGICNFQVDRKEYFDKSIIKPEKNEVFVDCGFYDGETSRQFIKWCNGIYKKIVAFEADNRLCEMYNSSKKIEKLELVNAACWDKDGQLTFHSQDNVSEIGFIDKNIIDGSIVEAKTIDGVLKGEKATFIKMDIEGSELNALKGGENTIRKYHPKLAISVYHRPEDIIEILRYILELQEDYKLYLRAYNYSEAGVVLYAI